VYHLTDLLPTDLGTVLDQTRWAEDEITAAQARHPADADLLYHSFALLWPTAWLMRTEWVYRGHCRELLDRTAAGGDPREPTNAEVAIACCEASLRFSLSPAGLTVYMRAWAAAFPDQPAFTNLGLEHYEHVAGSRADDLAAAVRRALRQPRRALTAITCPGRHAGQPRPDCRYANTDQT